MESLMIRRFEWIKNSGIFDDYHWDSTLPEFGRINVIYGPNGSGKTSLARALDATRCVFGGFENLSIQTEESGIRRSTCGQDAPIYDRLYVFSEGYVERSHRFRGGSPNIDAVLTLGERTAEAEEKVAQLKQELTTKTTERNQAQENATTAQRARTAAYERVSKAVVSDLSRVDGYRSRSSYNSGLVGRKYSGNRSKWRTLSEVELAKKKQFVASDNRDNLDSHSFSLTIAADLRNHAETLLSLTPVTIVLDTLRTNPAASSWVQAGQILHEQSDVCIFCGQPLPNGRLHAIEQHFSDSVAELQRDLDELVESLESLDSDANALIRRIPARSLLFEDLRSDFDTAAQHIRDQEIVLKRWIEELRVRVKRKRANVLENLQSTVGNAPSVDGSKLEVVLRKHNDRVNQHAELVKSTSLEIERHHLKEEEAEIGRQAATLAAAGTQQRSAQSRIDEIEEEIAALQSVDGDPTPSASVLTREVGRLLGRSELSFQTREGRYVVTRDGQPAVGLSVGERTAITLVHFLEEVARHDVSKGNPIMVIDDPVSSLDSNVFMGISTYIWCATLKDGVDQLFLLTHNFDLFRQWDIQLESLHRDTRRKKVYPAELYELKSSHVTTGEGRTQRKPSIVRWPESPSVRKKIRSSYLHAFIAVAQAKRRLTESDSLENRLDAQLLFPNVIRRILESFLAFKRPDWGGDFTKAMRDAGQLLIDSGYPGDADALRQQITRYAHVYSHSETPETNVVVNPEEIGSAIGAVFVFMNQLDHEHFIGLCAVIGADPKELLSTTLVTEENAR